MPLASIRLVPPVPELPVQRCMGFLRVVVTVHGPRRTIVPAALRRPPGRRPIEQLPLSFSPAVRIVQIAGAASFRISARARMPIRPAALRPFLPRRQLPGARPRSLGTRKLPRLESEQLAADLKEQAIAGWFKRDEDGHYVPGRRYPRTFGDCQKFAERTFKPGEKVWCPFVGCTMHLATDVDELTGAVKTMFPGVELWEMAETCTLRAIDNQDEDDATDDAEQTLERTGRLMNLTMESIRQTAETGLVKLRRKT